MAYRIVSGSTSLQPGERVEVKGALASQGSESPSFHVQSLVKNYGACDSAIASAAKTAETKNVIASWLSSIRRSNTIAKRKNKRTGAKSARLGPLFCVIYLHFTCSSRSGKFWNNILHTYGTSENPPFLGNTLQQTLYVHSALPWLTSHDYDKRY